QPVQTAGFIWATSTQAALKEDRFLGLADDTPPSLDGWGICGYYTFVRSMEDKGVFWCGILTV
ncbi:hypothetical protein, partial [Moraxella cuniculi]|uniref:hypothetical protein n=1 Tax=Moraxella cuniculi TaxID=34061 RepID=UPI001D0D3442